MEESQRDCPSVCVCVRGPAVHGADGCLTCGPSYQRRGLWPTRLTRRGRRCSCTAATGGTGLLRWGATFSCHCEIGDFFFCFLACVVGFSFWSFIVAFFNRFLLCFTFFVGHALSVSHELTSVVVVERDQRQWCYACTTLNRSSGTSAEKMQSICSRFVSLNGIFPVHVVNCFWCCPRPFRFISTVIL